TELAGGRLRVDADRREQDESPENEPRHERFSLEVSRTRISGRHITHQRGAYFKRFLDLIRGSMLEPAVSVGRPLDEHRAGGCMRRSLACGTFLVLFVPATAFGQAASANLTGTAK